MISTELDIFELAEKSPLTLHRSIRDAALMNMVPDGINPTAQFGNGVEIARDVSIGPDVRIGKNVKVKSSALIGFGSVICDRATIGPSVIIRSGCLILQDAKVCPGKVRSSSTDGRKIMSDSTIGEGVKLHDEVELDENAIVPNQNTITHLGYFGSKNRVVTIYGSDEGPRYSIGCQIGRTFNQIRANIDDNTHTTRSSADTYVPYLDVFNSIGAQVQNAYDDSRSQIDELMAMRIEYDL